MLSFLSKTNAKIAKNLSSKVINNLCVASVAASQCNSVLVKHMSSKTNNNKGGELKMTKPKKIAEKMSLVEILSSELTSAEADDDLDNELVEIINDVKKNFTIVDQPGNTIVTLTRKANNETIEVTFDCQDEIDDEFGEQEEIDFDEEEKEPLKGGNDDDEDFDEDDMSGIVRHHFKVTVTKSTGNKIVLICYAGKGIEIQNLIHVPAGKSADDDESYSGPAFDTLDDSLQEAIFGYLEDRKVDEDLSYFVLNYARHKEEKEYKNWLKQMMKFVE